MNTLFIISDYGTGDPAFAEVILRLRSLLPYTYIYPQSVPAFSTLTTGFWINQIALSESLNSYIYSNTAPRIDDPQAQKNNAGEKLMYAKLTNGFEIIAVNSKYNFSFIKPHIADFRFVNVVNEGSQFRSRDLYPEAVGKMLSNDPSFVGEKTDLDSIPDVPKNAIASIDGYGNMKTTIRQSTVSYAPGQKIMVSLNDQTHEGIFTDEVFNIEHGQLAFAPGSSGHDNRFMELFVRGKSAEELFRNPKVEDTVDLKE